MYHATVVVIPGVTPEKFDLEIDFFPKAGEFFSHTLAGPVFEVVYVCRHVSTAKTYADFTLYVKAHQELELYKIDLVE